MELTSAGTDRRRVDAERPNELRARLIFGTTEPAGGMRTLTAGRLSAELDQGNLRYVRWHGHEVVRGIGFVIRDTRWGTYAPVLRDVRIEERGDEFRVSYAARCESDDGDFAYAVSIAGRSDGYLGFRASGGSARGFRTCRTGFVVLHPIQGVAGKPVLVEHASGQVAKSIFPDLVSATQPIFDIRQLTHEAVDGLTASVRMDGDVFEMEDHRNWTDASYKTYARPLAFGYPYVIAAGEALEQSVSVTLKGSVAETAAPAELVTVRLGERSGTVPRLGLFVDPHDVATAMGAAGRLKDFAPAYLTGRIDLRDAPALGALNALRALGAAIECRLALQAVIAGVDPDTELARLREMLAEAADIDSVHVVPARDLRSRPADTVPDGEAEAGAILAAARRAFPAHRIAGGMTVPFAELNRNRPARGIDLLTHATQATVHAADDVSVMETLTALPDVIRSARAFAGTVPYRLGPCTIGVPPFTAPTAVAPNPARGRVAMAGDDPRQQALFGAAFALGLSAVASKEGLEGITFAAAAGPFGLLRPDGTPAPFAGVFAALAPLAGATRIDTTSAGRVAALAVETPNGVRLLLANLTGIPCPVAIEGRRCAAARMIDADSLAGGMSLWQVRPDAGGGAMRLDAYAVADLLLD